MKGMIPARAGPFPGSSRLALRSGVHPRACGVTRDLLVGVKDDAGSSPCAFPVYSSSAILTLSFSTITSAAARLLR